MSTWYKDGTASFANGSATVTGSGTSWVDNVKIGDALRGPDGRTYEIVELVSSAEIEISPAYEGSSESNADYAIQPTRGILQRVFNQIQTWLDQAADYLLADSNLSELTDVSAARGNLGLGTAATENDDRYAHRANNLSDIVDAPTARDNLGLGTAATQGDDRYAHRANNLSDLASAETSRDNLGLGTAAEADIVGTVSQSGGDPTGAVIERGSNSNGSYVRYADGTQICFHDLGNSTADNESGNIFRSSEFLNWTFPVSFSSPPVTSARSNGGVRWANGNTVSDTEASVNVFSALSSTNSLSVAAIAIGRWF